MGILVHEIPHKTQVLDGIGTDCFLFLFSGPGVYEVLKCGSFGHNIRSRPSLKATPIGMLTLGDRITAIEDVSTNEYTVKPLYKDHPQGKL